jgi:lipopolysaccharide transport system permease protein
LRNLGKWIAPIPLFVAYWRILVQSTWSQIRQKNAGTVLGSWWLIISPLVFLGIYTVVYMYVFQVRRTGLDQTEYVLHIFAGLVPFVAMSEGVSLGVSSLEASTNLLKNTVFPVELISSKFVLSTLPAFLVGLFIVAFAAILAGKFSAFFLLLPVLALLQFAFVQGITWVLSLIGLVFKDVKLIVQYALTIAMITSPIAYTIEMIPVNLKWIVWLNPFAHFILGYQSIIVSQALPDTEILVLMTVTSVVTFFGGYAFFRRLKPIVVTHAG